ncbi:DNA-binding response regulator [Halioglobus japonicus]|uniref:DNA-binding response regulator n=1 Tax=Halioglobus japonicus TaxID=930805 RepID=A0AAP8MEQ4_9GAMM|nr:response regulator transcription factor [Halioglobus japonicus]AQA18426.1 DNA-binding response regulator [Halioglobus japonicus]PLW86442.1 DNA-binding response regulator [Halioglobus japonicus]GHD12822.1 DNA-binding response regulator [Halioglobus japonicus]
MQVLLVEDDQALAEFIGTELQRSGSSCVHCDDGDQAYATALEGAFDVMVVDRMLPGRDGLTLIQDLRRQGLTTPALVLSALGEVDDRVQGLKSGADDYLVKPFAIDELQARLQVLLRRGSAGGNETVTRLQVADLTMDLLQQQVDRGGVSINLQPREYRLLEYLMRHESQVVTRTMLLEHVWGYNFDPQTNVIDVHISRLRQKLDKEFEQPLLHTVRGAGYRLGHGAE